MLIERNIAPFVVLDQDPLSIALNKINTSRAGFVLAITEKGHLVGILTDGDIRRWLLKSDEVNLETPVVTLVNTKFTSAAINAPHEHIAALFSDRIRSVPLVDAYQRIVAIAFPQRGEFSIADRVIGPGSPTYIIAEIGNNHNGNVELGQRLVDLALESGADCAKFQMRDMHFQFDGAGHAAGYVGQDLGAEYTLDLLSRFNLCNEDLFRLFDYCRSQGIEPLCTPWDLPSVEALDRFGIAAFKSASADLTNHELLTAMIATGKPLICSTGMASEAEIKECVALLRARGTAFCLLHCNSTYPTPYKDINLRYLDRLAEISGSFVGYSGHERGWIVPVAAVARGACIIEKHLTIDRTMEGNDHKVSLLPDEFAAMVQAIRSVEESLGHDAPRVISRGEMLNREVLAKSLYAERDIPAGTPITHDIVTVRSPGKGLQPNRFRELIGRRANRAIKAGTPFFASDLQGAAIKPRHFAFKRRWGVPVRWHDYRAMLNSTNPTLLEYHLSYRDMEANLGTWFDAPLETEFVVHAPELFSGDHILDLASADREYRKRSIRELQLVVDIARALKNWHPRTERPLIITNMGGATTARSLPASKRSASYKRIEESLLALDCEGVEIVPQTMPPFPWHFGGQAFHNLFIDPDEIAGFCVANKMRVCLDTSHAQLACNHFGWSMKEVCDKIGPYTAHIHLADARGVDGEGLQIGEGTIDFPMVAEVLEASCPHASIVPEIWQGHKDFGAGFWFALDKLEQWFGSAKD
jgi:sialic acid synthase SpsE/sugar phosphate isomerase/epimerase